MVSARIQHRLFEGNDGFRPVPARCPDARREGAADLAAALSSDYPVADTSEVYFRASARSTRCYAVKMSMPEITQRDLRSRSREIMDAVEHGQSFTVTRDGHEIGELIPLRRRRRFVARDEFVGMSRNAASIDVAALRADQAAVTDHELLDSYER